ncbi:hypothetical protein [Pseudanabaena sp. PCC 6802]|uniref:hypothetical protein n=1 Tax=Pseudanabaena sp. PCC 6802 TaxID=118173 RepID=UPI00034CA652|nr:hypothetical protein [Pseudanabaena sp. PCC 6802]
MLTRTNPHRQPSTKQGYHLDRPVPFTDKTPTYELMGFTKKQWQAFTAEQRLALRIEYNTRVQDGNW